MSKASSIVLYFVRDETRDPGYHTDVYVTASDEGETLTLRVDSQYSRRIGIPRHLKVTIEQAEFDLEEPDEGYFLGGGTSE